MMGLLSGVKEPQSTKKAFEVSRMGEDGTKDTLVFEPRIHARETAALRGRQVNCWAHAAVRFMAVQALVWGAVAAAPPRQLAGTGSSPNNCPPVPTDTPLGPPLLDACNWDELVGPTVDATPQSLAMLVAGWQPDMEPPVSAFGIHDEDVTWGTADVPLLAPGTAELPLYAQAAPLVPISRGVAAAAATFAAAEPAGLSGRFFNVNNRTVVRMSFRTGPGVADFTARDFPVSAQLPIYRGNGSLALGPLAASWPIALGKATLQLNQVAIAERVPGMAGLLPILRLRDALEALTGRLVAEVPVTLDAERTTLGYTARQRAAAATLPGHAFDRLLQVLLRAGCGGVGLRSTDHLDFMRDYDNTTQSVVFAEGSLSVALGGRALRACSRDGSFDAYLEPQAEYAYLPGGPESEGVPTSLRLFDPRGYTYDAAAIDRLRAVDMLNVTPPTNAVVATPEQLDALPRRPGGVVDVPWPIARRVITYVVF
ncbi:hypothetical protein COCOBI_13-3290 [Coccomyxa sp. Obi]|nr:hypothetical protein COCOBI_13-3290 [Coccomyxa sp. Obi]